MKSLVSLSFDHTIPASVSVFTWLSLCVLLTSALLRKTSLSCSGSPDPAYFTPVNLTNRDPVSKQNSTLWLWMPADFWRTLCSTAHSLFCSGPGSVWVNLLSPCLLFFSLPWHICRFCKASLTPAVMNGLFCTEGKAVPSQPLWAAVREHVSRGRRAQRASAEPVTRLEPHEHVGMNLLPDTSFELWFLFYFSFQ